MSPGCGGVSVCRYGWRERGAFRVRSSAGEQGSLASAIDKEASLVLLFELAVRPKTASKWATSVNSPLLLSFLFTTCGLSTPSCDLDFAPYCDQSEFCFMSVHSNVILDKTLSE